jgi:hypothetical protein
MSPFIPMSHIFSHSTVSTLKMRLTQQDTECYDRSQNIRWVFVIQIQDLPVCTTVVIKGAIVKL